MITIIAGTDRKGSKTLQVAQYYDQLLSELNVPHNLLSLENVKFSKRDQSLINLEQQLLIPTQRFIFVIPEYNGSYPGVLKFFIDHSDIRKVWHHKKAMITGIADGRAGNIRGLDHLTNVLNYLKINVFHNKIPISKINEEINDLGEWTNELTPSLLKQQLNDFLAF